MNDLFNVFSGLLAVGLLVVFAYLILRPGSGDPGN
jgi:hypothetical protein